MDKITLRDYNLLVNELVTGGRYDEAIFHAGTILKSYPKCVDTYRALAMALLGDGRLSDAADVFSKILAVYPEDALAHINLSEIYEADEDYDAAIRQMELAFESQPSDHAIQENLKKLLTKQGGTEPAKIRLTSGALVRMYVKGELYPQAISESLSILETDSQRVDIELLLAKSYLASGSEEKAIRVYEEILVNHPYCFEANQMLDHLKSSDAANEEPSVNRQRMIEVEPYLENTNPLLSSAESNPPEAVILDLPNYLPEATEYAESEVWREMIDKDTNNTATRSGDEIPTWITDAGWTRASIEDVQEVKTTGDSTAVVEGTPENSEVPDWVKTLYSDDSDLQTKTISPFYKVETSETGELGITEPVRISKITPGAELAAPIFPVWLKSLGNDETESIASEENVEVPDATQEPAAKNFEESSTIYSEPEEDQLLTVGTQVTDAEQSELLGVADYTQETAVIDTPNEFEVVDAINEHFEMDLSPDSVVFQDNSTKEGAISAEVNRELLAWLEEIDPEAVPVLEPNELTSSNSEHEIVSQVVFPTDVDNSVVLTESVQQEVASPPVLQDDQAVPARKPYSGEDLQNLLREGKYSDIRRLVKKESFADDVLRGLESKAHDKSEHDPSSFELWKTIGDLNVQLADLDKALEAYRKAENLLFHQ